MDAFLTRIGVARLRSMPPLTQLETALGRLPPGFAVAPILHDVADHICANSAVGISMQYRWLQLIRRAITFADGTQSGELQTRWTAERNVAAEALLNTIAQGLAHFAEFDCCLPRPDSHDGLTVTDCVTIRLLGLVEWGAGDRSAFERARSEQLGPEAVRRKVDVLSHPWLPADPGDTHLVGYALVKTLWDRYVGSPDGDMRAADFFEFLFYYFFEDWTLAAILVSPGPVDLQRVADRITARIATLFSVDLPERVSRYARDRRQRLDRGMLARGPEESQHGPLAGLDLTRDEVREALEALVSFHRKEIGPFTLVEPTPAGTSVSAHPANEVLLSPLGDEPHASAFRDRTGTPPDVPVRPLDLVLEVLDGKRKMCVLVDLQVEVQSVGADLVFRTSADGTEHRTFPYPGPFPYQGPVSGRLVSVLMTTGCPSHVYCLLFCDGRMTAGWVLGESFEDVSDEALRIGQEVGGAIQLEGSLALSFEQGVDAGVNGLVSSAAAAERAAAVTRPLCDSIRRALANHWGSGSLRDPPDSNDGLAGVLAPHLLAGIARLGLVNSFTTDRDEVAEVMREYGMELNELVDACADLPDRVGLTLLRTTASDIRAVL